MYRRSRKGCNVNVIHRITSETIRLSKMDLKPDNKPKNSEISSLQQSRKNPSGSFQITSVCLTGRFDTGEDSADDLDESRTEDISRLDNETPSCSEDTSFSRDGDDCYLSSPNKSVPFTSSSAPTTTTSSTTVVSTMYTTLTTSPASTSIGRTVGERFKVVKMESVTPFTRGRWKCLDYVDHSKHTPPDGWVFCNDKYVKLTEVQAAYKAQAQAAAATSENPSSGTDSVVCTFTTQTQAVASIGSANYTDPGTSYQRQYSAPAAVTNYSSSASAYPNQQIIYGSPPLMQSAPLQWQYAPQMCIPPLMNMQPSMPLQMMNYQPLVASPQTVTPVQQYIQGPVQPQQTYVTPPQQYVPQHSIQEAAVLLQQSTTQQQSIMLFMNQDETAMQVKDSQLIEEVVLPHKVLTEVRRMVDQTFRTSSMPPTPTTTPVEFGEKLQKRKTSSPGIEESSYGTIVKVMTATDITVNQGISTFAVEIIEPASPRDEKIGDSARTTVYITEIDIKEEFDGGTLESEQPIKNEVVKPVDSREASRTVEYVESSSRITDDSASGASAEAIDSKIEQAMDLVKDHLLYTIRGEVDILKERIAQLMDRINQLEIENNFLRENASPEVLCALQNGAAIQNGAAGSK